MVLSGLAGIKTDKFKAKNEALFLLEELAMADKADKLFSRLSGGQQQHVLFSPGFDSEAGAFNFR